MIKTRPWSFFWDQSRWYAYNTRMLSTWLLHNMRTGHDVLMPCKGKCPMFKHSENNCKWWTWDDAFAYHPKSTTKDDVSHIEVGILLHDLCVVDVDDSDTANHLESTFPILRHVPMETTKRGRHYYFARSRKSDVEGYYCSHSAKIPHVDFKTRHSNGTRAFVVVAPSSDKAWVREPWDRNVMFMPIPDDLLDAIATRTVDPYPYVKLVLSNNDKEVVRVPNNEFWRGSGMLEPVMGGEWDHMIMPEWVTAKMVRQLNAFMEASLAGDPRSLPETRTDLQLLHSLANMMGISKIRVVDALNAGRASCMFDAFVDHKGFVGSDSMDRALYDVTHSRTYDKVPAISAPDSQRLFHSKPRSQFSGEQVALVIDRIPQSIRELLKRHSGNLVLAGGAALHATCGFVTRCNDYDMYIVDHERLTRREACDIAFDVIKGWPENVFRHNTKYDVDILFVSQNALTARIYARDECVFQLMLKTYASIEDILESFDFDPCKVAVVHSAVSEGEGFKAFATKGWMTSVNRKAFCIDPARWHASTALRALKYYAKGFDVYLTGLIRSAQRSHKDLVSFATTSSAPTGMHDLLLVEGEVTSACGEEKDRRPDMQRDIQPVVRRWKQRFYTCSVYEDQPCTTFLGIPVINLCYKLSKVMSDVWTYLGNQSYAAKTLLGQLNYRTTTCNASLVDRLERITDAADLFDVKHDHDAHVCTLRAMMFHPDNKEPHAWKESPVDLRYVHDAKKYLCATKNLGV